MGLMNTGRGFRFVNYSNPSEYRTRRGTSPMGEGLDFTDWCEIGDSWRMWRLIAAWTGDPSLAESVEWFYTYIDRQQRWHMGGRMWESEAAKKAKEPKQMELFA